MKLNTKKKYITENKCLDNRQQFEDSFYPPEKNKQNRVWQCHVQL